MAKNRRKIDAAVQERLGEGAAELRHIIYGEQGFPEWGTTFAQIEDEGMAVGLGLARLLMEQPAGEQATHMPEGDLDCGEETAQPVGTDRGGPQNPSRRRRVGRTGGLFEQGPPGVFSLSGRLWGSGPMRRSHRICKKS